MTTEDQKRELMTNLALSFPVLRSKQQTGCAGIAPWDVLKLVEASRPWTPSEKLVVAFLATVWDSGQEYTAPFNLVEAFQRWDRGNFAALRAWVAAPFFC